MAGPNLDRSTGSITYQQAQTGSYDARKKPVTVAKRLKGAAQPSRNARNRGRNGTEDVPAKKY